jgi:hypothetical protein
MKKSGSHKWLLGVGALVVVLSLGAVACGSADSDQAAAMRGMGPGERLQAAGGNAGGNGATSSPAAQRRQAMQERREARAERQQALLENARAKMSQQDQAAFDQLTETLKQQRAAVQGANQDLAATLKELRALVDKYLDLDGTGTN